MMKKWLILLIFLILLPITALCEDWYLTQVRVDTENAADIEASVLNRSGVLNLREDGSASLSATDMEPINGTWTEDEGNITLTGEDGTGLLLTRRDDHIELKTTGLVLVFSQVKSEPKQAFTPPNAINAENPEVFFGEWEAVWCIAGDLVISMGDVGDSLSFRINADGVWLLRGNAAIQCDASMGNGTLILPDLGVALALDDDGSLSMVQGSLTFFLYPVE